MGARRPGALRGKCNNTSCCQVLKAVVQSVLLYGSETWNLTKAVLAQLAGFHVRAAYKMARKYKPCKGLFGKWKYPSSKDVLKECGLHLVEEYIQTRRTTIAMYVVDRPLYLECREGGRQRGSMPCASGGGSRSWA